MINTVCIVDDDEKYAQILKQRIEQEPSWAVSNIKNNAYSALELAQHHGIDIIIMDIQLPDGSGVDLVQKLKPQMQNTHFIMNTSFEHDENIFESLKAGASGYIIKTDSNEKIIEALNDVMSGGAPMSAGVAKKVIQYFSDPSRNSKKLEVLSQKENEILEILSKGYLYKEIATLQKVTIDTIKKHCSNIYKKLHVNNRTEAINIYLER
ncbi:MAG: response regulator transcription factor [Chitinophagaceae bacterium]